MTSILFQFEIRYWLRNRTFYLYLAACFLFACATMAGAAGLFGEGSAQEGSIANSPFNLLSFTFFFNKLLILLVPAITGITVNREIKDQVHKLVFTYPITRFAFLASKMLASFCLLSLLALAILGGFATGAFLANGQANLVPFDTIVYIKLLFLFLLPNLFLVSGIVFTLVLFTRNATHGFLGILLLWLLREVFLRITAGTLTGYFFDPLGESIFQHEWKFFTLTQRNEWPFPVGSGLIANRIGWILLTIFSGFITYRKYRFSIDAGHEKMVKTRQPASLQKKGNETFELFEKKLAKQFDFTGDFRNILSVSKLDFRFIARDPGFLLLAGAGQIMSAVLLLQTNPGTDLKLLPTTAQALGYPIFFYSFLVQLLTFLYAGVVINRASQWGMQDLFSVTPVPNRVLVAGKLLAVVKMQVLLLLIFALSAIAIQWYAGYYHVEIWLYLKSLAFIHLPGFIIWAMAAIFVHSWVSNTYAGLFLLLLFGLSIYQLADMGIQSSVFRFNTTPESDFFMRYSDMNGYGHAFVPFILYKTYWFFAGMVLVLMAVPGWQREKIFHFKERISLALKRTRSIPAAMVLLPVLMFLGTGAWLYYEENKPGNIIYTAKQEASFLKNFEKKFEPYFASPQPVIRALNLTVSLFPEKKSFTGNGIYTLKNTGTQPIDTLLLKASYHDITQYHWKVPVSILAYDSIMQVMVVKLSQPLAPQDSMQLFFSVTNKANTLLTQHSAILENGTYLKSDFLPRMGWHTMAEGTQEKDDTLQHYQGADEHGVRMKTEISTSIDQVAFGPGTLTKTWTSQNRNYYRYETEYPVKLVFGLLSGRYHKTEEIYQGIPIRIYHHPQHTDNISQLLDGVKASLEYNTEWFGPYLHKDINMVAFSRSQGTFASLSANCITVSETRFMQDTTGLDASGTNLSFYVMAHELSHHWWGNQLLPARAPGATMLTESVAEYLTTRIYEKKYGKERALKFLSIQKNRYLSGVADANTPEKPLVKADGSQDYITYGKGSIAFYTLSEKTGEKVLNRGLASFLQSCRNGQPPYPLASGLINHLRTTLPPNRHTLLTDLFETTGPDQVKKHAEWWGKHR